MRRDNTKARFEDFSLGKRDHRAQGRNGSVENAKEKGRTEQSWSAWMEVLKNKVEKKNKVEVNFQVSSLAS